MGQFGTDLGQFFAYSALARLERLTEAGVRFTFEAGPLYLSCYAEAMARIADGTFRESDPDLLRYAQVFERFSATRMPGVSRRTAARLAATFYWLAGYSANATVIARALRARVGPSSSLRGVLSAVLARADDGQPADTSAYHFWRDRLQAEDVLGYLRAFIVTGEGEAWERAEQARAARTERAQLAGQSGEFVAGSLLSAVLRRLRATSLWETTASTASAPRLAWQRYAVVQAGLTAPLVDLWPSQRAAIAKGLLDAKSSLVLRMPTSAGKTKMTELAFVNDLFTDDRRCLYLAPFRALVSEVEGALGPTLSALGIGVASLYGGAESNEIEVELSQRARVVIGTPEKMAAVLRMSGGRITDFGTIVLDEGHLLGSPSRGAAYELQLAALRAQVAERREGGVVAPRVVFLSAVLPNAETIAAWLADTGDALAESAWQPTTLRVGVLTWPDGRPAQLRYAQQPGELAGVEFFVPRVLEEEVWAERHPETRRLRTYRFPDRRDKASTAAALAFRYATQGPVIVYAQLPAWADSVARRILDRLTHDRPVVTNLVDDGNRQPLAELAAYVDQRLGEDSLIARALRVGAGLHHGGVPITIRLAIEDAYREQTLRLLIATNTVSQGVNFPVKTVVLHSLPRGDAPIREFWNLAGRAGRAMRETDGEVVLLQTGDTGPKAIARVLDRGGMEPADSQILGFVRAILERYPRVTSEAIDALLAEDGAADSAARRVVAAIDTQLLELMVEDVSDVEEYVIDRLVANLLATSEAVRDPNAEELQEGVATLIASRRARISELVPDVTLRRRFARTGVPADAAVQLDQQAPAVVQLLATAPTLTADALGAVVRAACAVPDLRDIDAEQATVAAWAWTQRGSYLDVLTAGRAFLLTLDDAVEYVERVVSYALPWITNGLLRLLEPEPAEDGGQAVGSAEPALPDWFRYLPQFFRFGTREVDLVWVMSLGIPDPAFAAWVRDRFVASQGRSPPTFREMVAWAVGQRLSLERAAASEWPRYFGKVLSRVLERYEQLWRALDDVR